MGIGEFNTGAEADSSPVVSKLSLLINYSLGKRLGYARGKMARSSLPRRILITRDDWGRVRGPGD